MKRIHYTTLFLICLGLLTACVKQEDSVDPAKTGTGTGTGKGTNAGGPAINLDKTKILALVNQARAKGTTCGNKAKPPVNALKWSDELAKAALDHSNDMQKNKYFDHKGLNGSSFGQRAKGAGYAGFPTGENIALGYADEDAVIKGWLESTGHCNNIMNGNSTEIGIAKSAEGRYWTMVLGKAKN